MKPKAGIFVFPGTNCDYDTFYVLKEVVGIQTEFIFHTERGWSDKFNLVILPGGFSYGDYLRPGAIAKISPVIEELHEFVEKEKGLVLGICNGFQVLTEAGFLKGALIRNDNLKFICKNVSLKVEKNSTPFTNLYEEGEIVDMPIAHSDGKFIPLEGENISDLVVFRYHGENPNGSFDNIAGITNEKHNVLGMMPHPERCAEEILGGKDGLKLFESIKNFLWGYNL